MFGCAAIANNWLAEILGVDDKTTRCHPQEVSEAASEIPKLKNSGPFLPNISGCGTSTNSRQPTAG
jgi:hypothetical protein